MKQIELRRPVTRGIWPQLCLPVSHASNAELSVTGTGSPCTMTVWHTDDTLNASDAVFSQLAVWQDANGDGRVEQNEYHHLGELGIASASAYLGFIPFARNESLKRSRYKKNSFSRTKYEGYMAKRHSRPCANEAGWWQVA